MAINNKRHDHAVIVGLKVMTRLSFSCNDQHYIDWRGLQCASHHFDSVCEKGLRAMPQASRDLIVSYEAQ